MRLKALLVAASFAVSPVAEPQTSSLPRADASQIGQTPTIAAPSSPPAAEIPAGALDRVRDDLSKPPSVLRPGDRPPDFTVFVVARRPLQALFETPAWVTAGAAPLKTCTSGWSSVLSLDSCAAPVGSTGFDILPLLRRLWQAKHAHDARAAHDAVQRDIEAYCASQPGGGQETAICPAWSSLR